MENVIRFDLVNMQLPEPVDIPEIKCSMFPEVRRVFLSLFDESDQDDQEFQAERMFEERSQGNVSLFVEIEGENRDERYIQERCQEFVSWVCWLLSLAEMRSVYYWGSHHYIRSENEWKLVSSAWKPLRVKEAKGSPWGGVPYWRLPTYVRRALEILSKTTCPRQTIFTAIQLFTDSLPYEGELSEFRFLKKWLALEIIINKCAHDDHSAYVFGTDKRQFDALKKELLEDIRQDPRIAEDERRVEALTRQLTAMRRVPISMLAMEFLSTRQVTFDESDLVRSLEARNKILHEGTRPTTPGKTVNELDGFVASVFGRAIFQMIGWDYEQELKVPYEQKEVDSRSEYAILRPQPDQSYVFRGKGSLREVDGTATIPCYGEMNVSRKEISGKFMTPNPLRIFEISNSWKTCEISLDVDNSTSVLVEGAKVAGTHMAFSSKEFTQTDSLPSFKIVALKALRLNKS